MADSKVDQIKASVKGFETSVSDFLAKLKEEYNVDVKAWDFGVGKVDKGVSVKVALEVVITKK